MLTVASIAMFATLLHCLSQQNKEQLKKKIKHTLYSGEAKSESEV